MPETENIADRFFRKQALRRPITHLDVRGTCFGSMEVTIQILGTAPAVQNAVESLAPHIHVNADWMIERDEFKRAALRRYQTRLED